MESALLATHGKHISRRLLNTFWSSFQVRAFLHSFTWEHLATEANAKSFTEKAGCPMYFMLKDAEEFALRAIRHYRKYLNTPAIQRLPPAVHSEQPRPRGRPPIATQNKVAAVERLIAGGTYKDAAVILYETKYPTKSQSSSAWTIIDRYTKSRPSLKKRLDHAKEQKKQKGADKT